jgi:protocatechuate 3,4-dioxygenase alpha subunit
MSLIPTPSQTVGPFLHLGLAWLNTTDLAKNATAGERIAVAGSVLDGDGKPIPDALLELWQANAYGKYAHPEDTQDTQIDLGFSGFGRIPTDKYGRFRFVTIKPGATPGPGNTRQAPHIVVAVFMRGMLKHLYTRIYFSVSPCRENTRPSSSTAERDLSAAKTAALLSTGICQTCCHDRCPPTGGEGW